MALLYRYYPLALENTLAHFWLLLLQLFLSLCLFLLLKIAFFIVINSYVRNKVDLTSLDSCLTLFIVVNAEVNPFIASTILLRSCLYVSTLCDNFDGFILFRRGSWNNLLNDICAIKWRSKIVVGFPSTPSLPFRCWGLLFTYISTSKWKWQCTVNTLIWQMLSLLDHGICLLL